MKSGRSMRWTKYPLKKIVRVEFIDDRTLETLECGHQQYATQDFVGETSATRRRCKNCKIHEENNG